MGFYTVVVFNNDVIHGLEQDLNAGKKILQAIGQSYSPEYRPTPIYISYGHVGDVVEQQHADNISIMALSIGRGAKVLGYGNWGDDKLTLVKRLADGLGYVLRKRPTRKKR